MKRIWCSVLLFLGLFFAKSTVVSASEPDFSDALLSKMDFGGIQKSVDELLGEGSISFSETLEQLLRDGKLKKSELGSALFEALFDTLAQQKQMFTYLLALVLATALFANFSGLFENSQLSEMSFYLLYLLLFAMLLKSFALLSKELKQVMQGTTGFMEVVSPAYFLAVSASTGASTAVVFYQMILLLISVVEKLLIAFVLPGIHGYILLQLVNHLSKEDFLSRMAELLKVVLLWSMRTVLAFLVGMQVIQNMIAPAFDSWKRTALGKTAGAIPGVGNALSAVTQMVLGSAVLIRNGIGVTAVVVLFLALLPPVLHLAVTGFLYKLLAAFAQPVSDSRIVGALGTIGEGCGLLLKLLCTEEALFILTIAILTGT